MASSFSAKVAVFDEKRYVLATKCITLHSEAEEETGSVEEQPASNRLSHYTEIVFGTVIMHGCAFSILGGDAWLRKPNQAATPHDSPKGSSCSVSDRQTAHVP